MKKILATKNELFIFQNILLIPAVYLLLIKEKILPWMTAD